ncbi:dTDP-4-amino-4,6-dideoxygalactose transaminase [Paenibacillus sp. cl130]|jgi:dTDP-4-amino-4,6-dideoxygalactose transaminase|nr:hypothetical protein [Paenibacillus sp. cl130]SFR26375.1 dTDP-4-amino-4,6-dideoxygalactose transaminase [Paenibacillus sp. cl130]
MDKILDLANRYNLAVVEDAAQEILRNIKEGDCRLRRSS